MKKFVMVIALFAVAACSGQNYKSTKLQNDKDSASYAIGADIARTFTRTGIDVNPEALVKGYLEYAKEGETKTIEDSNLTAILQAFQQKMMAERTKKDAEANSASIKEGEDFLEKNKADKDVKVTESGLQYKVIKMGNGPKPKETDVVKVHYTGKLIDGTVFDSSVERGEPATFPLDKVIPGWTEGVQLMPVGSKFEFFIPAKLAYGERGAGDLIKPNSTLIFEVELLGIEK